MGALTAGQIVDQALDWAGNPSLSNQAFVAFNAWLRRKYAEAQYHQPLHATATATVGEAFTDVSVSGHDIVRVQNVALVNPAVGEPPVYEPAILPFYDNAPGGNSGQQSLSQFGLPTGVAVRYGSSPDHAVAAGAVALEWFPKPDKAYPVDVYVFAVPAAVGTNDTPDYLNDETMIQAVYVWALRHQKDAGAQPAAAELMRMEASDRALYGARPGQEESWKLDSRNFDRSPVYSPTLGGFIKGKGR